MLATFDVEDGAIVRPRSPDPNPSRAVHGPVTKLEPAYFANAYGPEVLHPLAPNLSTGDKKSCRWAKTQAKTQTLCLVDIPNNCTLWVDIHGVCRLWCICKKILHIDVY